MQMNLIATNDDVIQYTSTVATMSTQTVFDNEHAVEF